MGASEELEYLKSLVAQLNEKIKTLEEKTKPSGTPTPAQQLRTILVGPPGAGNTGFSRLSVLFSHPNPSCRKGNTSSPDTRPVLRMPSCDRRHVA